MLSSTSILNSQLHSQAGSQIKSSFEFHEGAAIPPKKLFGSKLLCIITKVEPDIKLTNLTITNTFIIAFLMKGLTIKSKN